MKQFARLFQQLDQTNSTKKKVRALANYFDRADDDDKLWCIALMSHRRPRRTVNTTRLREWAAEMSQLPLWLFEESYHIVGDLAETIALVLPDKETSQEKSLSYWVHYIKDLKPLEEEEKAIQIQSAWKSMSATERFVFNKIITGGMRVGVSQKLMTRALAAHTEIDEQTLAHRLMGNWTPDTTDFESLILSESPLEDASKPYPFFLAYAIEKDPEALGSTEDWIAEPKWDGIRGQLIVREDQVFVWSRGEELVTDKFPEFQPLADLLPNGTVLDGEILPWNEHVLSFNLLQTRIGRKNLSKKILKKAPVILMAFDLLEWEGRDFREKPMHERRKALESLIHSLPGDAAIRLSPLQSFSEWKELEKAREHARENHIEGFMLKRKTSTYQVGRKKGDWWKWKADPLTIDGVMIYAQRGHGRRANLYTDFTFAVRDGEQLIPFAKAYSGLTDDEFREVNAFIRKNTLDRYGPVRVVKPELVFEIAFEGINASNRHKSGVAVRFPRIKRWRKDKTRAEANTLDDLKKMLEIYG